MRMKLILALVVMSLCGCMPQHKGWQTVMLGQGATIKFPEEWQYTTEEGIGYVLDHDNTPVMIELNTACAVSTNKYYSDIQYVNFITAEGLSNSATYGTVEIVQNGKSKECLYLDLSTWHEDLFLLFGMNP